MKSVTKNLGFAQVPADFKKLRSCMICSLVKSEGDFDNDGCNNCESFLQLAGTRGSVFSYTSANFEGLIGLLQPEESWIARWQRIVLKKPGMYALNVVGEIDNWIKKDMDDAGILYFSRDKTKRESRIKDKDQAAEAAEAEENGDEDEEP